MFKYALIALAVTASLSTAATAQQSNINVNAAGDNVRSATVNIADLKLTSAADQYALRSRVRQAALEACTFDASRTVDNACALDAKRDGMSQANAAIAAANGGRLAAGTIVLHGAR